jgi:hypothetical protein
MSARSCTACLRRCSGLWLAHASRPDWRCVSKSNAKGTTSHARIFFMYLLMKISSSANAHAAIVGLGNKFALRNAKFFLGFDCRPLLIFHMVELVFTLIFVFCYFHKHRYAAPRSHLPHAHRRTSRSKKSKENDRCFNGFIFLCVG